MELVNEDLYVYIVFISCMDGLQICKAIGIPSHKRDLFHLAPSM